MKKLIPTPHPEPSLDPSTENPDDITHLLKLAESAGFEVTPRDIAVIWYRVCERLSARWISPRMMEASAITTNLMNCALVVEDATGRPPPPDGYTNWLDYAAEAMDTQSVELELLYQDTPGALIPSREAIRQAVHAELNELRLKAGGFTHNQEGTRGTQPPPPLRDIVSVETQPGYNLKLKFDNGEVRRFKMTRFVAKAGTVFKELRKRAMFEQAYIANGTVCWPGNIDLDPELLYEHSTPDVDETERRIGVAKGLFEVPPERTYPRDPDWEALPDVGAEVWPAYSRDVAAWAVAQSTALRQKDIGNVDWANVAEEILDVAKAAQRELGRRVSDVMFHLYRNQLPMAAPRMAGERLLGDSRKLVAWQIADSTSLERCLSDDDWLSCCWTDAIIKLAEAGLPVVALPEESPWRKTDLLNEQ